MDLAREKALAGEAPGAVVVAEFQTAGRGRQGRVWFAPPGANICLTAIAPPVATADGWQIALVAGVAAVEAILSATGIAAAVRFPNDIYVDALKLGGILIETAPGPTSDTVIPLIGIGININVPGDAFPPELRERATSTLRVTGREFAIGPLVGAVLRTLGELWDDFERGPFEKTVLTRWRALAEGKSRRTFFMDGQPCLCRVVDLSADGRVLLEDEGGIRYSVWAAQVILGDD
jgi:BirA family biotin operon repressor/biotin-[acetyl-CoA-carboxylase] ligase